MDGPHEDYMTSVSWKHLKDLLVFVSQRALQNHKLHQDWNEGAGEFSTCTRGDCAEAREILLSWEPV